MTEADEEALLAVALEAALAQSGEAQLTLSKYDLAIQAFDKALRLTAHDAVALDGRGVAYLDAGKSQQLASSVSMCTSSFQSGWVRTRRPSRVVGHGPSIRMFIRSRCWTP